MRLQDAEQLVLITNACARLEDEIAAKYSNRANSQDKKNPQKKQLLPFRVS